MARPRSYRDLIVWQKGMALARLAYMLTEKLPKREAYGLADQIRRAAISVPSNVAEGYGRLRDLQFRHFLGNARGSLYELQTQVELAAEFGYLDKENARQLMEQGSEVARVLNGLLTSLRPNAGPGKAGVNPANSANPSRSANSANSANAANSANKAANV